MSIKLDGLDKLTETKRLQYLKMKVIAQLESETNELANFSNITSIIYHVLKDLNWVGFYFVVEDELVLGPFQGKPACTRIGYGKGVCGTAWKEKKTMLVSDVESFPGHIACDSDSRSELVIPLIRGGKVYGVLDIDSPIKNRFTEEDRELLEEVVSIVNKM